MGKRKRLHREAMAEKSSLKSLGDTINKINNDLYVEELRKTRSPKDAALMAKVLAIAADAPSIGDRR